MEQHPVPQNITGFQFKLIGDMTIRQFLYLAAGILTGYLTLQLGIPSLIKWGLAFVAGTSGFALAFVPIEERPLDRWFSSFLKSVYSPTRFFWKKGAIPPEILTAPVPFSPPPTPEIIKKEQTAARVEEYLLTLPATPMGELDQQEAGFLAQISSFFGTGEEVIPADQPPDTSQPALLVELPKQKAEAPIVEPPKTVPPSVTAPLTPPVVSTEKLGQQTEKLTAKIGALQQELTAKEITQDRFSEIQAQLAQLLTEKERLTQELVELKKLLAAKPLEATVKPTIFSQFQEEPRVKIVSSTVAPKIGMPKPPTTPNAPSGMVKTQKGIILPGIIVEIRDQEGTPIRALKTGKLGQFVVSTALSNGTYTLHLEDPQKTYYFDIIELTLTDQIVSPLEIFAKTQKDKTTEELRKKLFSQDNF